MITYTKESKGTDEDVRIKKLETKDIVSYISVRDLKQRHAMLLEEIKRNKEEADEIVEELQNINNAGIESIKDIPKKFK